MSETKKTNKIVKFFKDLVSETKKVVWPSKKQVINNTGVVLAVCAIAGVALFILDTIFGFLVELIYKL